ncbi:O-succinylbenzoic acid--CoA ligase [Tersicoccus solisilvae]|uniref:O-succinylbenzoic acid--CoA ligase n=1 Tax=Tersicoccus solisilvae TaxID=1882339 RepID=A0ABQ1NN80_9MICC|nr:AMP-binding protein [Tersicoccus solisilvae]GGC81267.1 O-succinylbenzoic acid--CoA ligase [Tersicoccus solisilvae]
MSTTLRSLHLPRGADPLALLDPLAAALSGGPAVVASPDPRVLATVTEAADRAGLPAGTAAIVSTSGSTGTPKRTLLPASALRASADATRAVLGGAGQWLLALPGHYVAGLQVLSRSVFDGTRPVVVPDNAPFDGTAFRAAVARMSGPRRYASMVPAQLALLVDGAPGRPVDATERAADLEALRGLDTILLGGARADETLLHRVRDAGVRVVTTYGMSETCGGCVYDGVPLPGVRAEIADDVIRLGGPVVAGGYLGDPELTAAAFSEHDGVRWFTTSDTGTLDAAGLTVTGRADDVINTGGLKVSATVLARTIEELPGVRNAFVTGLPDPVWGQRVAAWVAGTVPAETIRAHVADRLGGRLAPKVLRRGTRLPMLPTGKPDRQRMIEDLTAEAASTTTAPRAEREA